MGYIIYITYRFIKLNFNVEIAGIYFCTTFLLDELVISQVLPAPSFIPGFLKPFIPVLIILVMVGLILWQKDEVQDLKRLKEDIRSYIKSNKPKLYWLLIGSLAVNSYIGFFSLVSSDPFLPNGLTINIFAHAVGYLLGALLPFVVGMYKGEICRFGQCFK